MMEEQSKGNYVVAAGDFNQIFSSKSENPFPVKNGLWVPGNLDIREIHGDWKFLSDERVPSCRSLDRAYKGADPENFQYYLIDGYIVSSNIQVDEFATQDLGFVNSDHNPVLLKATLK